MGTNEIRIDDVQALGTQAQLHYETRDFCLQIAGEFESKFQAVVGQLSGTQAENYRRWWEALKPHLLKLAAQQDQYGHHLELSQGHYEKVDPHTTSTFERGHLR